MPPMGQNLDGAESTMQVSSLDAVLAFSRLEICICGVQNMSENKARIPMKLAKEHIDKLTPIAASVKRVFGENCAVYRCFRREVRADASAVRSVVIASLLPP